MNLESLRELRKPVAVDTSSVLPLTMETSWDFLVQALRKTGISEVFIKWVNAIISSAKISILINGGPCGFFSPHRGLRQARCVLVKDVLSLIPIHNMAVYWWPSSLIKEAERSIRNFLWSGDPSQRKMITIGWDKVCKPVEEGGLGIRRLREINVSMLMKLAWQFKSGDDDFSTFMRGKFLTRDGEKAKYKISSLWPGLKRVMKGVHNKSQWIVCTGERVDHWRDNWVGNKSIQEGMNLNKQTLKKCSTRLSSIMCEGTFN
ncbi:hypothetical protein IFM89_039042 [Coptis chinensis]|uniref:Uncharacterized protein n=1 Tax=Coptis chinensis TaxID=261450 RepID=A0A835J2J3_9MAGN|nr:hypothetical protein IFM89_039042 [Coptis chinensis]